MGVKRKKEICMKKKSVFEADRRTAAMLALALTLGMAVAGCNNSLTINNENPLFVPVTGITGVPSAATAGSPLTLAGTVAPADATNKTIVWSVLGIGVGATIDSGITLQTETWGRATVLATIVNGATTSTNYVQTFEITVTPDFDRLSLAEFLAWLQNNAVENGDYTIELSANETIEPTTLSYSGKTVKDNLEERYHGADGEFERQWRIVYRRFRSYADAGH
jgi:hypothetical protein